MVECWRVDVFELWFWRRLLRVPWTTRRSNQSILKKINPEYSLRRLMLKLKLQYFGHLMWRTNSLEKTLMLGKTEGTRRGDDRGWDGWMASPTQRTWIWANSGRWWWTGKPGVLQSMGLDLTEWLNSNRDTLICTFVPDKLTFVHGVHFAWNILPSVLPPPQSYSCFKD